MTITPKTILLDILTGAAALIMIDSFSMYIYFDYVTCIILTSIVFLCIGILRGKHRNIPHVLRISAMNLPMLCSFFFVPLPFALFVPIVLAALFFTFIGFVTRLNFTTPKQRMKSIIAAAGSSAVFVIAVFLWYPPFISNHFTHEFHQPASEFTVVSFHGDTISSRSLQGKVVVLDFWESSCGPCVAAVPGLEKLKEKYAGRSDVKIYCVDVGWKPIEKEQEFVTRRNYTLDFVYDRKSAAEKALGFGGAGFLLILDKHFTIRLQHLGYDRSEDFVGSLSHHIDRYASEP
jgi:thiol-disulfide isomerase/thioredoxin